MSSMADGGGGDLLDLEERSGGSREKGAKDEDEEVAIVGAPSVEMLDFVDPTILRVGTAMPLNSKFRYSKEELLKLKESPYSLKRPDCLDVAYDNNNGIWDPERWHCDRKSSEASTESCNRSNESEGGHGTRSRGGRNSSSSSKANSNGGASENGDTQQRRSGDPRDRIRKEHDGIVLSPQRRSFNTGCCVPVREPPRPNRSHSPLGGGAKNEAPPHHIGHREIPQGAAPRRIGSGRIFFDYAEKAEPNNEFAYRRERRDTDRDRDERYDRRSFGRETEPPPNSRPKTKDGGIFARNGGRYDRRRISNDKEEEPEWFSEGPISQHDTIELRGFDESEKLSSIGGGKKRLTTAQKKKAKERATNKSVDGQGGKEESVRYEGPGARSTPNPLEGAHVDVEHPSAQDKGASGDNRKNRGGSDAVVEDAMFTIEDMLKSDSIQMLLPNGVGLDSGDSAGGSKFSRWFSRERNSPPDGSRRSSVHDDPNHLIKNILKDITEPTVVSIPCDSDSYFAPISPAANTATNQGMPHAPSHSFNIMEMLQRGNKMQQQGGGPLHADLPPAMKPMNEVPGKLLSVEELETRIRQQGDNKGSDMRLHGNKSQEDNTAFQKLLAQMQEGQVIQASNGAIPQQKNQPMSIMEMLTHSQKEEAARLAQMMNSSQLANDINYKMQQTQAQQRQIEAFSKLLASGVQQQTRTTPPLNDITVAGRELLNRPEAQAILQGLKRGDITPQHLYQQLANPALQSRHRELLQVILKVQGPGSRVLSPVPPHHPIFQQQQQQLRVSPLPPNAMHQRIPSPRELQVHTQKIMQRALIKKKLEEQQENFRKKQELQQRGTSPGGASPSKSVGSPTQLAFTPTAVLRKMTADKEEGNKDAVKDGQSKGRAVTGMRNQPQQQSQSQQTQQPQIQPPQWAGQFQQISKQPAGRPIVKNSGNFQQQGAPQSQHYDQFVFQQQRLLNQQVQQQQQQHKQQFPAQFSNVQQPQQQYSGNNAQQQQYIQHHQLRAQHQQQQQHVRTQHQQQQQHGFNQQWQQIIQQHTPTFDNRQVGRGGGNDGDMSPTSNQLARWFSPDLLERARKGKLPNMPASGRAQHALSLEELERQTAPVIHN